MDHTQSLPSAVGGPSTITNAREQASSTRPQDLELPSTAPDEPLPRAFGRYELRRLLGRGGMGSVYLAHDSQLDRDVALKIPRPFGENPTLWRERFFTEARAAAALRHENICPVHDVGEHDGQPFLTMAFIDGDTLSAKLRAAERLPVGEAVEVVAAVARAMAEAHAAGVVHRDLKPGNVMIDGRGRPVVMDFGLALRTTNADDLRVTLTGVALGTPAYMPPEQAGGDVDAIGPPADVYALGVILFELVTGRTPFRAKSFGKLLAQIERDPPPLPSSLNPDVPPALDALILTALSKAPADRFPTAAEFADALEHFQAGRFDELTSRYGAALSRAEEDELKTRVYPVPPKKPTRWWPAVAVGFFGLLVLLVGAIYVSTDKGDLKVEFLDPDTGKPIPAPKGIDVKVNGQSLILDPDGKPIRVRAGEDQMLVVTGDEFVTESHTFTLKRWKDAHVQVTLIPKERLAKRPEVKPDDKPKVEVKPDLKPEEKPKPKPVPYPKDKTLVKAGDYETLLDATQEQIQAWLDEKKQAKHSVLWLDVVEVDGKPLFSAVAASDSRETGWTVQWDLDAKRINDNEYLKTLFNVNERYSVSGGAYFTEAGAKVVLLLWPGQRPWAMAGSGTELSLAQDEERYWKQNGSLRVLRPYAFGDGTFWLAYWEVNPIKSDNRLALTRQQLFEYLAKARTDGNVTISLAGYISGGAPTFAAVVARNTAKVGWEAADGLTAAEFTSQTTERAKNGFHPSCVTAYAWDGAVRYCVVWVKEPPKPTPYPKDKVVVKQDGFETLLDATKEQMQAWLDDKKKAKHSVLWLDAYPVDGKPLYSAVAALDDRQANWTAMLDLSVDEARNVPTLRKMIDTEAHTVASMGGFARDGEIRVCLLWRQEAKSWGLPIGETLTRSIENFRKAESSGAVARHLRPFPAADRVIVHGFFEASLDATPYSHGLSAPELNAFLADQRKGGAIPSAVSGYVAKDQPQFAVVCRPNKDKVAWEFGQAKSPAEFAEQTTARAKTGFRPASVTAYAWDGAVRYCVVWVKDPPKPTSYPKDKLLVKQGEYETLLDATKEQMQTWLDEKKKAKHSVLWLDAVEVDGKPLFSAVAALDERAAKWGAVLDLDTDEYNDGGKIDELFTAGKERAYALSGYPNGGKIRCAILWGPGKLGGYEAPDVALDSLGKLIKENEDSGCIVELLRPYSIGDAARRTAFTSRLAIGQKSIRMLEKTSAELDTFLAEVRKQGARPLSVTASVPEDTPRFTATAVPNPDKWEWEVTPLLTSDGLKGKVAEFATKGFRPQSVTACPWDGAVRYCVVWVKDPPKPVPYPKDKVLVKAGDYETLLDATQEQMQSWLDEKKKAKHSVLWLDACEVDGKPVFSAVAALDDRAPKWKAFLDTPAEDYGNGAMLKRVNDPAHYPLAMSGYGDGGKPRSVSLWQEERTPYYVDPDAGLAGLKAVEDKLKLGNGVMRVLRPYPVGKGAVFGVVGHIAIGEQASYLLDASEEQLVEFVKARQTAGERVTSLTMHVKAGRPVYAVVGGSFPDKADWRTDKGLTAEQYATAVASQAKTGFRPASVTACPWDGAVRYAVVWVKEKKKDDKKEPPPKK